jgi:hypothetical protein
MTARDAVTDEEKKIVAIVEGLSDDACYMASRDWFGGLLLNRPILAVAENDRQRAAFEELMSKGLMYLDTERGQVGYRSTDLGRMISGTAKYAISG